MSSTNKVIVGYRRVSSTSQSLARQELPAVNDRIFEEKISAKSKDRPALQEMLQYIRSGDTVHVHSIDRLARNLRDLEDIVETILRKEAEVVFLKEGLHFAPVDGVLNKPDPFKDLMLQMLGAFAQFERSLIDSRRQEGIEKAKAEGKYTGRKATINKEMVLGLLQFGVPAKDVSDWMDIGIASVYRLSKKAGTRSFTEEIADIIIVQEMVNEHLGMIVDQNDRLPPDQELLELLQDVLEDAYDEDEGELIPPACDGMDDFVAMVKIALSEPMKLEQRFKYLQKKKNEVLDFAAIKAPPSSNLNPWRISKLYNLDYSKDDIVSMTGSDRETVDLFLSEVAPFPIVPRRYWEA